MAPFIDAPKSSWPKEIATSGLTGTVSVQAADLVEVSTGDIESSWIFCQYACHKAYAYFKLMEPEIDGWEALQRGQTQQALQLLQQEYERAPSGPRLNNMALALLELGQYEDALAAYEHSRELEIEEGTLCEGTQVHIGIAHWLLGNTHAALEAWAASLDTPYADSAGGVLGPAMLWYGAERTGETRTKTKASKLLRTFWKYKAPAVIRNWPGPAAVAGYILGKVPTELFLNQWQEPNPTLELRRRCRANFWVGVRSDSPETAKVCFSNAFSGARVAILESEYFLAKWEFQRAHI